MFVFRLGTERLLSNSVESLNPLKTVTSPLPALTKCVLENSGTAPRSSLCPKCLENYDKEQAKLAAIEKSFSEAKQDSQPSLPAWLQNAKLNTTDAKTEDESQVVVYYHCLFWKTNYVYSDINV